jgi:hypothetical protein
VSENIEIIREALELAQRLDGAGGSRFGARWNDAKVALTALETELATLRANALDLSRVPEGWEFISLAALPDDGLEVTLRAKPEDGRDDIFECGPTPAAALNAACARVREVNDE